jgi:hypothetical protein
LLVVFHHLFTDISLMFVGEIRTLPNFPTKKKKIPKVKKMKFKNTMTTNEIRKEKKKCSEYLEQHIEEYIFVHLKNRYLSI